MTKINNFSDNDQINAQLIRAILETVLDGIVTIDQTGEILMVNQATCALFGYQSSELIGQNIRILMPQPHRAKHDEYIARYIKTGEAKIIGIGRDVVGKHKQGREFPIRLSVSELAFGGKRYFTGVIHDLTAEKKAQEEIRMLNAHLESTVEQRTTALKKALEEQIQIQQKMLLEIKERQRIEQTLKQTQKDLRASLSKEKEVSELKSRFVSLASHEFRTPLSTILSSAAILKKYIAECNPKVEKHINRIKLSVNNLNEILNDFLSLSKIENKEVEAHFEHFNPVLLCRELVEELKGQAKEGQEIVLVDSDVNSLVSDRRILKNILVNLITNAIRYSPPQTTIRLSVSKDAHRVFIKVADEGMGITESDKKHLFTRFFRGKNVEHIKGTGLGLHIVKQYCSLIGAEVKVDSKLGEGSVFSIIFNLLSKD